MIGNTIETVENNLILDKFATGDYYCIFEGCKLGKIIANTENTIKISTKYKPEKIPTEGSKIEIQVRLQHPYVDIERCIGCGVCEHECPVSGKKAIRVSAEGETRSTDRRLLL